MTAEKKKKNEKAEELKYTKVVIQTRRENRKTKLEKSCFVGKVFI